MSCGCIKLSTILNKNIQNITVRKNIINTVVKNVYIFILLSESSLYASCRGTYYTEPYRTYRHDMLRISKV